MVAAPEDAADDLRGLPFLCYFIDERMGVNLDELGSRADLREFIDRELGILHLSEESKMPAPKILMLTGVHDPESNLVGVELLKRGVDYIRLNSEDLFSKVRITYTTDGPTSETRILVGKEELTPAQVRTVWYRHISPELFGPQLYFNDPVADVFARREWQWAIRNFTNSLKCFWVNPPDAVVVASNKLLQIRLASEVGLDTPRTVMTNDPSKVWAFYESCGREIIAKAVSLHFVEVKGRLFNFFGRRLRSEDLNLLDEVRHVPSIFQEYVPKSIEVRVTVVGDKVLAAEIHSQVSENSRDDYHRGTLKNIPKAIHHLPEEIERKCRLLVHSMGLLFGALDMILTPEGRYVFLEVNAGAAWWWIESQTGLPITEAVVDLLIQGPNSPATA